MQRTRPLGPRSDLQQGIRAADLITHKPKSCPETRVTTPLPADMREPESSARGVVAGACPSTVHDLVDKLLAFYQQGAVWVHHTRASLELALTVQGRDSFSRRAIAGPVAVKTEPASPPPLTKRNSRWLQRKQTFNLNINLNAKLDSVAPVGAIVRRSRRRAQRVASPQTCTQLLDLYSEHMEARMASCVNLAELARSVNQPPPALQLTA